MIGVMPFTTMFWKQ
jgi:hypothetical protein